MINYCNFHYSLLYILCPTFIKIPLSTFANKSKKIHLIYFDFHISPYTRRYHLINRIKNHYSPFKKQIKTISFTAIAFVHKVVIFMQTYSKHEVNRWWNNSATLYLKRKLTCTVTTKSLLYKTAYDEPFLYLRQPIP